MSLYGDLGVKEGAASEEIRAAYLRLAKEVHPDKVQNERERLAAERRMSRLNQIMDVLSHDVKRAEYDAELTRERAASDARVRGALALQALEAVRWGGWPSRNWRRRINWIGAGSLAVLGLGTALFVISMGESGESPVRERTSQAAVTGIRVDGDAPSAGHRDPNVLARSAHGTERPAQTALPFVKREDRRVSTKAAAPESGPVAAIPSKKAAEANASRDALVAEVRRALEIPRPTPRDPPPPHATAPVHRERASVLLAESLTPLAANPASPAAPSSPPPLPLAPTAPAPSWRGLWRYAAGGPVGYFEAVSIEMRLQEAGGRVHGVYKAQYRMTGAGHSGDVDLVLRGISFGNDWLRGVWSGNGGAYGQFELKRTGGRTVEMNWWTTRLGSGGALASGSARLLENGQ